MGSWFQHYFLPCEGNPRFPRMFFAGVREPEREGWARNSLAYFSHRLAIANFPRELDGFLDFE